jgi:uncharacterized membrane protein
LPFRARERNAVAQRVQESIEVQAPVEDIFRYWSNFENFSTFMANVEEVRMTGQDTSHWRVKGPLGKSVEFEAKTTEMDPNRGIGWNTVEGDVVTSGEVRFEEAAPGRTRVDVTMNYSDPPGGAVGEVVANILSDPERNLKEDLENFARIVERGELGGRPPAAKRMTRYRVVWRPSGERARRPLHLRGRNSSWVLP